ncbi:MAG: 7-cyano-7-deazaguanine synthase [Thaumarchaeota archaeon]|nr:7-cyano-7-deazaguanine synthase [Nitrososphaerota archaeon]
MIALALSESWEEAAEQVAEIAAKQKHRTRKPARMILLETELGYAVAYAQEARSAGNTLTIYHGFFKDPSTPRRLAEAETPREIGEILREAPGFYSGAIIAEDRVTLFKDHAGHMPLAYRLKGRGIAAALERQALGFEAEQLPPGALLTVSKAGVELEKWYKPSKREVEDPVAALASALSSAAEDLIPEGSSITFSGGLDSSLLAFLASRSGKQVELISVGYEGCFDHESASEAASLLDLDLKLVRIGDEDLAQAVKLLEKMLPKKGLMDLALASIFYHASKNSGSRVLIAGQGADELFGGYWKYAEALEKEGLERASALMESDVENLYLNNLERDELASALGGSALIAPYLDREIYDLALSIHPSLKLKRVNGEIVRKWVLRRAAERLGLPKPLVERPKKAAQYGSGVLKRLRKILGKT